MSNAKQIYNDNVGHTHDAAVEAVYSAGVEAGKLLGNTVTETVTVETDTSELEAKITELEAKVEELSKPVEVPSQPEHPAE
jgi:hypothetical protein